MTKDEINARIAECEAELVEVRADLRHEGAPVIMPVQRLSSLTQRQGELMTEIAGLKAKLDEL